MRPLHARAVPVPTAVGVRVAEPVAVDSFEVVLVELAPRRPRRGERVALRKSELRVREEQVAHGGEGAHNGANRACRDDVAEAVLPEKDLDLACARVALDALQYLAREAHDARTEAAAWENEGIGVGGVGRGRRAWVGVGEAAHVEVVDISL